MKKVAILLICVLCLLTLSGCGLVYMDDSKEKTAYNDAITALFDALDERDNEAIYNLFSSYIIAIRNTMGGGLYAYRCGDKRSCF